MLMLDLPNTGESLSLMASSLPSGHSRHIIANGVKGTAQTIEMMQKLVANGKRDDDVREVVGKVIQPCRAKDYFGYAKALYTWVRDNIKYAYDPHGVEYLEKPARVLKNKIADCDSQDMLLCSMFEQIGLQSQFVTIKADASRPDEYTHVYTRVLIPKVGWVCADPIMPEKWFGWEPPYPDGKRYWPASTDDKGAIDTSPSVPFPQPCDRAPQQMSFDPVNGMSGLGRGGRGHHGGRGRGGWGGGAYYGGPFWGGGFDDNVYVLPVAVPMPDQIMVVEGKDVEPQELESPLTEQNFTMGTFGMDGILDVITNPIGSVVSAVSGAFGPSLPVDQQRSWITSILDGSAAQRLRDARNQAFAASDKAAKALKDARALPDSARKTAALNAANALYSAASKLQYSINDAMAKYNELAAIIADATKDKYNIPAIPRLSGLGNFGVLPYVIAGAVTAVIVSGLATAAIVAFSYAMTTVSKDLKDVEVKKLELVERGIVKKDDPTVTPAGSIFSTDYLKDAFNKTSGTVVSSALTIGAIGLGVYIIAGMLKSAGSIVDSKIRQTLKVQ